MVFISRISAPQAKKLRGDGLQLSGGKERALKESAAAAGQEKEDSIVFSQRFDQTDSLLRGGKAGLVWDGMPRLAAE